MENLASVYALLGRWDEALEVFDMILRRGTRDRKVELARASVLYAKGEFQRTLEAAQKIIDAHPQWSEPYELSAVCYAKLGSPERAREYLKRAVELDAKNTGALANYAYMLYEDGRLDEAYDMATRALEGAPDVHALLVRGAVLAKRGQLGEALADFTAAARAAPRDVRTHQHRALALIEMGRYDEAIEAAERVKKIDPRETARADRLIEQARRLKKGEDH
jgi:pentatricopeptide repeat protein